MAVSNLHKKYIFFYSLSWFNVPRLKQKSVGNKEKQGSFCALHESSTTKHHKQIGFELSSKKMI